MGPGYLWWGPMCFFPIFMPIIMLVGIGVALYFVLGRGGFCFPCHGPTRPYDHSPESALETLKKRYAKGEITKEEFEQMQMDIQS